LSVTHELFLQMVLICAFVKSLKKV
jgi:hypothetical protein